MVATVAAGLALLWELVTMLAAARTGRSLGAAVALAGAALVAGPVLVVGVFLSRPAIAVADDSPRHNPLMLMGLRGSLVAALAALIFLAYPVGGVVTLALAAIAWALRSYSRTTSPIKPTLKRLLLAMRIAAVVLVAMLALRPSLEYRINREVRGVLLIGIDASGSMSRKDAPRGNDGGELVSRREAVARAIADAGGRFATLADQSDLDWFLFAQSPRQAPMQSDNLPRFDRADGEATAIGDSLSLAINRHTGSGREVSAVLLISDGCNNTSDQRAPDALARQLGAVGVRVYTVGVGPESITDRMLGLNVRDLSAPDEVQAFNKLGITANIECIGLAGKEVTVTCTFGDQVVGAETLTPREAHARLPVRFAHVPLAAGFHRLSVRAQAGAAGVVGEPSAGKLVHVVDREMRILYIEGRFRNESKFVTQALSAGERFAVNRVVLTGPLRAKPVAGLSERIEDWMPYHALILGDVPAEYFSTEHTLIMRRLVGEFGKGLCMIGGRESFGAGGWDKTVLANVLPVELDKCVGQIDEEIKVVPTPEGLASDLLRIGNKGDDVAGAWAELPPLLGANRLDGVKLAAQVLATGSRREPLIVAQRYEKGRSLAIAFDTTWRWVLNPKDTAEMQRRFWRQVAIYLCAPKGNVWIASDRTAYDLRRLIAGQEVVEVTAGVEGPQGQPMPDAKVAVTLSTPDGKVQSLELRRDKYILRTTLPDISTPGVYTLKIAAPDVRPEPAQQQFEVVRRDLEALDVLANHELLRQMAASSHGRYAQLGEMRKLLAEMSVDARPKMREEVVHQDLAGEWRWPWLAVAVSLLCAEWAIRKRRGLV
jgi:hypothetical protein